MDNSSNKIPLLLIGIFFLMVFIGAALFIFDNPKPPVLDPEIVMSPQDVNPQQEVTVVTTVATKNNTSFVPRDFLADSDVELIDEKAKVYLIGSEQGPEGPLFEIFYYGTGQGSITISLQTPDLFFARGRAEEALQAKLDVSLLELCSLDVSVTVPYSISPILTGEDYSGVDLGLPSCPGSVVI